MMYGRKEFFLDKLWPSVYKFNTYLHWRNYFILPGLNFRPDLIMNTILC